jgi:LuxR family maltose regulon positive regulatory protein
MTRPLLQTKLYTPPIRPEIVARPRLIDQLDTGFHRTLTLVSAPAGSGKTTLLSRWMRQSQAPAAWLSLDTDDNDAARFWSYLVAALQILDPDLGRETLQLLHAPQQPSARAILTLLLNDLGAIPGRAILVLDDYHLISNPAIHEGITFLLEHLPPTLHVVIAARADPPLPTHRLRARGQMTDVRFDDLRFTTAEAMAFLNAAMGLDLRVDDVEALATRTEGWIVGLQLAALSLRDRADAHAFIATFSGGHHYVLEYLVEEVVHRRPQPVQQFLVQTSILDRLCGPLCDAVISGTDSAAVLADLHRRNLFIVPLDDTHHWYRYHHLFADLLRNLLRKTASPELIRELHRRACSWYEQNGIASGAVNHALAAEDFERTAQLIERYSLDMVIRGELATLLRWINALPEAVAHNRPWLCIHQAWPLTFAGDMDGVERLLQQVESLVPPDDLTAERAEVLGHVAAMRAMLAVMRGDMARALAFARQADTLLSPDDLIPRAIVLYAFASGYYAVGDLAQATTVLEEEVGLGRAAGNIWTIVRTMCDLADLRIVEGRLQNAIDLCRKALRLAEERGAQHFGTVGYAWVKLGEVLAQRGDLATARDHIIKGVDLMQGWQQPYEMAGGYTALSTVLQALGDAGGAREALEHAEEIQVRHPNYFKVSHLVDVCRVGLVLAQDGPEAAWLAARTARLGDVDAPVFREREQIAMARVLVAQEAWEEVRPLLARMAEDAEAGGRLGRLVEILTLQAAAYQQLGDIPTALTALERAIAIAAPEGYARIFVEGGAPLADLLRRITPRSIVPDVVQRWVGAHGTGEAMPASPLTEPLTDRETEVLHLLGAGYTNQAIADALFVTINTVKKHTNNIYGKLGVHSRTQAVVSAQDLGLL